MAKTKKKSTKKRSEDPNYISGTLSPTLTQAVDAAGVELAVQGTPLPRIRMIRHLLCKATGTPYEGNV